MTNSSYTLPSWLTDEQVLRDEAVLFGLSEARPDEKIASIRLAFTALTAPLEKQIEQHHEAIGNLNLLLETADNQQKGSHVKKPDHRFGNWPVGSFSLGILLSLTLCAGTYLGTLQWLDTQLALLMAGLAGGGTGTATLLICQAIYRRTATALAFSQQQYEATQRQIQTEKSAWLLEKKTEIEQLYRAEATLNQQQAQRDLLIRLFESEFDLARSLRHQIRDRFVNL
ncbi:hypothetical protein [Fibrella aquatica]|uniref:hypothetical protein n=1 Tax=Fibrella aquatica TaxID=3242487 RepID=UPI003521CE5F